ncbi:hypothetical protein F441_11500, partial [Phytophthora nicotianae CJ01A1]
MPRLRSGRVQAHSLVVETATVQIAGVAELDPAKPATSDALGTRTTSAPLGDTIVTDVSWLTPPSVLVVAGGGTEVAYH